MTESFTANLRKQVYIRFLLRSALIARFFPFSGPPVLLISYPRSGSSWIGDVLSTSPSIAYLREPVSDSHDAISIMDAPENSPLKRRFERITRQAFNGVLPKNFSNIKSIDPFLFLSRNRKRLFIKEIDFAGFELFKQYNPQLIILLRHPAAIADSYRRMNWIGCDYELFAYRYGTDMLNIIESARHLNPKIILYEDIALHPQIQFVRLFCLLDATVPDDFGSVISRFCHYSSTSWRPYETNRISSEQIHKWKRNLDPGQAIQLKQGFFRSGLPYYTRQEDWADI